MNCIIEEKSCKEVVLKSKFFSFVFFCENVTKQNEILKKVRGEHQSASHICFASSFENQQHSNDDGEPSGTAGAMILTALKESEIINVLCVVVRYFGGVKLGASRLGKVYKNCAKRCLEGNLKNVEKQALFFGNCNYNTFGLVKDFLQKNNIKLENVKFENEVDFEVFVSEEKRKSLEEITPLKSKNIFKIG